MPQVIIDWAPRTQAMGEYYFVRATDGDTPFVELPVRMLSIDTAETHFWGKPIDHQEKLDDLRGCLQAGEFDHLPAELRNHLTDRLDGEAGRRQYVQGLMAAAHFEEILEQELRPQARHERSIFVLTSGERFDRNGRLLAYLAKHLTDAERKRIPRSRRQTFNLQMVAAGWAAPMPIYPSLPRKDDLQRLCDAARQARESGLGIWSDPMTLLPYEYRMCRKMQHGWEEEKYLPRYCADLTTKRLYNPQDYLKALPENRLFIWRDETDDAVRELDLTEA